MEARTADPERVVVIGAGIAGLEFAFALADMAGRRAAITVVSPQDELHLKPMVVTEPFGGGIERYPFAAELARRGIGFVRDKACGVDLDRRRVGLGSGSHLSYDTLAVCVGGTVRPAYSLAATFWSTSSHFPIDDYIRGAAADESRTLALVVPPGMTWPLPIYELALLMRRRSEELGSELEIRVFTPELSPLAIFGERASAAVATRLRVRDIAVETGTEVIAAGGTLRRSGGAAIEAGRAIALPIIDGPAIQRLPHDGHGFIPIDEHCRVVGADHIYAAGDGTSFPVKQGGIATQQADAAAEHLASSLGAAVEAKPFRPVLRGELLTGDDSIMMVHELGEGETEGTVSPDYLWWPRLKVAGRYLSAWLTGSEPQEDLGQREMPIEVEASWPHNWHSRVL
jgi:sulfide:quinone oxidoreductase